MSDRLPPHDPQAEAGALGCVLLANGAAAGLLDRLTPDDFYDIRHQAIFRGLRLLRIDGKPIDPLTVVARLRQSGEIDDAGGHDYVLSLPDQGPTASNFDYWLGILQEQSTRRAALRDGTELARLANDPQVSAAALADAARRMSLAYVVTKSNGELTIRTPAELLAMTFDDSDCILGDRLMASGQSVVFAGQAGVGKSRLALQLAVACITGRSFVGIETHAPDLTWLVFQVENTNRRLKDDLMALRQWCGADWQRVNDQIRIHTLEGEADTFVSLDSGPNSDRIAEAIQRHNPGAVIWDSLYNFGIGDLNKDSDMAATLAAISRLTKQGRPERVPVVLHHALTGRHGASRAVGYERSGFARNSKVLLAWSRAQINVAPGSADSNNLLVLSCGKNSNGLEFPRMGVTLDAKTMIYQPYPDFDFAAWEGEVTGKQAATVTLETVREACKGSMSKKDLARAIMDEGGCGKTYAYRMIQKATGKVIHHTKATGLYVAKAQ